MALADRIKAAADGTESKPQGSLRADLFKKIAEARSGSGRKDLPLGKGIYFVSEVKDNPFTSQKNKQEYFTTKVILTAMAGNGPDFVEGDTYEYTIFRNGQYAKPEEDFLRLVKVFGNFLSETAGCHPPLTDSEMTGLKSDGELCLDLIEKCVGLKFNQGDFIHGDADVSLLSGNVFVEINGRKITYDKKVNGTVVFDSDGNAMKGEKNVYDFIRQVSLEEAITEVGDDDKVVRFVGGQDRLEGLISLQ